MTYRFFRVLAGLALAALTAWPGAVVAAPQVVAAAPDAPLLLQWTQRNVSGFGDRNNGAVSALEFFNGWLYAGTTNDTGAQLYRTSDGTTWEPVALPPGFPGWGNGIVFDLIVFNGQLYLGTGSWPVHANAGQIWRTANGTDWERVTGAWEANANNAGVNNFATFGGALFMTTYNPVDGIEVYRSATGNPNDWARKQNASFGLKGNYPIATGLIEFNNMLYVALSGYKGGAGLRVFASADGASWGEVSTPGFGDADNFATGGFAVHSGNLYLGVHNDVTGGQIWRTPNGTSWAPVVSDGFGSLNNYKVEGLVSVSGTLFAFTDNDVTGTEVWSSTSGTSWEPSNLPGFGSANNKAVALWSNGSGLLGSTLFLGTFNQAEGGQVWGATPPGGQPLTHRSFLPFILRP